jgi:hypothetical protein
MKQLKNSMVLGTLRQKLLATVAGLAIAGIAAASLFVGPKASGRDGQAGWEEHVHALVQVAELDQLLADFHGALSYGGNLTAMMSLWADDSSITFNGALHAGKDGVQAFFANGGPFHHNWVSLAPEYKTQITVHGNTAEATTQCVFIDLTTTPNVVLSVIQVNATMVKHEGKWVFTSMNNTSPAPL